MNKLHYHIQLDKPAAILHVGDMVESITALSNTKAEIVVFIDAKNKDKFEKLLDAQPCVQKYYSHPTNDKRPKEAKSA